jgi:hypothetical protein
MELEKQVCSLELAQKLKTLGVRQDSLYYWSASGLASTRVDWTMKLCAFGNTFTDETRFSAFTVAELGEMLPKYIEQVREGGTSRTGFWLDISFDETSGKWRYSYANHRANECIEMLFDVSEADARAKMLIYLMENSLVTL